MALENPITSDDLTIDFAALLDLSVSNRVQAAASDNKFAQALIASLTPIQMAQAFPDYYRRELPDISNFILGNRYLDSGGQFDQRGGGDPGEDKSFYDGETAIPEGQNPTGTPEVAIEDMKEMLLKQGIDVDGLYSVVKDGAILENDERLSLLKGSSDEELQKMGFERVQDESGKELIGLKSVPAESMTLEQAEQKLREEGSLNAGLDADTKLIEAKTTKTSEALEIDQRQYNAFRQALANIESQGGEYGIIGGAGNHYSGAYQFGRAAMIDSAKALGMNVPTREEFLKNPELQEQFLDQYTALNHKTLMRISPKYKNMTPEERLGVLGYAHNQGAGGAAEWLKTGAVGSDAFGTKGTKYTEAITNQLNKTKDQVVVDPNKKYSEEELKAYIQQSTEKQRSEVIEAGIRHQFNKASPTSIEANQSAQGNGLMAQGDLENINYNSAPQTSTAATGYTGSGTSATKVSEDYVNNQFLGAADFMTGVGIWPGGENPYFSESTSGKYKFDPKGGIGIDPVHKGQGHYGFKGQLAYDISVARMVQQAKDAGVKLSERDAHNVVTSMRDFLREQTGGAAGGTQEQKGQLGELYGPERGVMREKTGESGHYRHMHYAPGTNLQRGDYNQMLQTLLSNPSALNDPKTGNPSKTAARLLADLEKAKFVVKKEDGTYARNDAIMPKQMKTALGMDKPKVQVAEVKPEAITPATPSVTENTVFIGDSIAHGLKDAAKGEGNTKVGRKPSEVLSEMEKMGPESFKGKKVVLSTGLSNDTADLESVRKQMQFLKDAGADVQIAGMSNSREDLAPGNQQLQQLSSEYGYSFMGGFDAGKDKIHPTSYGKYAAAAAESIQAAEATPAVEAPATPLMADTVASGLADYDPSKVSAASLGAAKFGVTPESKKRMIESIEAQKSDSEKKESTAITPTNHVAGRDAPAPIQTAVAETPTVAAKLSKPSVIPPGTNKHQADMGNATSGGPFASAAPTAEAPAVQTPKAEAPAPIKFAEATPAPVQVTEAIPAPTGRPEEVRKFRTGGSPDVQDDENLSVFDEDGSLKWKMNSGEGIYVKPKDTEYADDKIDELAGRVDDIDQRSDTPEKNQPKAAPEKAHGYPEKNWQQNASTVTYSIGSQGRAFKRTKFQNEGFHFNRSAPNSTSS